MSTLLAIDWGSSTFRAYLLNADAQILDSCTTSAGIKNIAPQDYEETLLRQLEGLKTDGEHAAIISAGMITSRQGWLETPYLECPSTPENLALHLASLSTETLGTIWFVPGIKQIHPDPDIMRGEETQLAGIEGNYDRVAILPGTHCKWVQLKNGAIERFRTFMTGDIYQAVTQQTILKMLPVDKWSKTGFERGLQEGYELQQRGRSLLSSLFRGRVRSILALNPPEEGRSFISGLLIATEIAEAAGSNYFEKADAPLLVIGTDRLSKLYLDALNSLGHTATQAPADLAAKGLYRLAKEKGLL